MLLGEATCWSSHARRSACAVGTTWPTCWRHPPRRTRRASSTRRDARRDSRLSRACRIGCRTSRRARRGARSSTTRSPRLPSGPSPRCTRIDEPLVLIAGGRDKHLPMDEWAGADRAAREARGAAWRDERPRGRRARARLDPDVYRHQPRGDRWTKRCARRRAAAQPATWCCFRPGGTSYDMYPDFEERGRDFARAVRGAGRMTPDARWKRSRRRRPDYLLLASTVALLVLGALMVYSASFVVAHNEFNDDAYFLMRQLMWIGVGIVGLLAGHAHRLPPLAVAVAADHVHLHRLAGAGAGAGHRLEQLRRGALAQARPGADPAQRDRQAGDHPVSGRLAGAARTDRRRVHERVAAVRDHRRHRGRAGRGPARSRDDGDHHRRLGAACFLSAGANLLHIALLAVGGGRRRAWRCWRT